MKMFNFEIEVMYDRLSDDKLNARLDFTAEKNGGMFVSNVDLSESVNGEMLSRRRYGFDEEDAADDFQEEANHIISRHFGIEPIKVEELQERLIWSTKEAVYHHLEFNDKRAALRYATWLHAVYVTYMEPDMYDLFVVEPPDQNSGYLVVWAFPRESVIEVFDDEFEDDELKFPSLDGSDKKKVMN